MAARTRGATEEVSTTGLMLAIVGELSRNDPVPLGCQHGHASPDRTEDKTVKLRMHTRTRTLLAWLLFVATFGCCAGGLAVTVGLTRPLTAGVLVQGAAEALVFRLGFCHHRVGQR